MTLGLPDALRNAMLDQFTALAGGGAKLRVYDDGLGSPAGRPFPSGAAIGDHVLLVEAICGAPFAPPADAGVLSPTPPASVPIIADGYATWFRVLSAGDVFVMDGTVGDDMLISNQSLVTGEPFDVTSWVINAPNP